MAHVIIGTAGHIDHGKSTLIKRLTGIETDRLKEEKKRGITIELGFAYFDLPSGKRCGIVDVPGHEKFIKHMLAGAGGIDIVLMVIAADEGIMPQTKEHIDILNLLGIKNGIVCLTKADMVEEEWLEMMKVDIAEKLEGSFLEGAPIISLGLKDDEGLNELKSKLDELALKLEKPDSQGMARLPIDRVFSLTGFGTVVTGTLIEGKISVGDRLVLYPKMLEARVRNIQVHSQDVTTAYSGQRVAINIANLKVEDISRGNVLAAQGSMKVSYIVDADIALLPDAPRSLANWSRLRVYYGSNEVLARLVLLDREELNPGEKAFVQLRLEEESALKYGDRFVIRFFSPLETLGGGTILDPNANKHKRFKDDVIEALMRKSEADHSSLIEDLIIKHSKDFPGIAQLVELSGKDEASVKASIEELKQSANVLELSNKSFIHRLFLEEKEAELLELLTKFYAKEALKIGLNKDEIRTKLFGKIKPKQFEEILNLYFEGNKFEDRGRVVATAGRKIEYDAKQAVIRKRILDKYNEYGFNPENLREACQAMQLRKTDMDVLESMVEAGEMVRLTEAIYLHADYYKKALDLLHKEMEEKASITLAIFRDLTNSSRKIAMALLDHYDAIGLTYRDGDVRKLK